MHENLSHLTVISEKELENSYLLINTIVSQWKLVNSLRRGNRANFIAELAEDGLGSLVLGEGLRRTRMGCLESHTILEAT